MQSETLEKIGLTHGEAKTYLALLETGQSTTGPIVEKSQVSTSKTYKILKRLENKGLVSHIIKSNVVHWSPASPKRILELLEEQEKSFLKRKKEIKQILPELLDKVKKLKEKQQAEVYMGMEGMKTIFNEETDYLIKHPKEVEHIIGIASVYQKRYLDFFERLEKKRDKLKLKRKMLLGIKAKKSQPWIENSKYVDIKYLDYPDSPVSINIFGETSFIVILTEEPIFLVIKSKEVAESFKHYFNLLWKIAKK